MRVTKDFQTITTLSEEYVVKSYVDEKTDIRFLYTEGTLNDYALIENYILYHYKNQGHYKDTRYLKGGLVPLLWMPSFLNQYNNTVLDELGDTLLKGIKIVQLPLINLFSTKEINYSRTFSYSKQVDLWVFREDIAKAVGVTEDKYSSLILLKKLQERGVFG